MSEKTVTTSWEMEVGWESEPHIHSGSSSFRFVGDYRQLRVVMDCLESYGFKIANIQRNDAMTAEDAIKHITDTLRPLAFISQKSKVDEPK